MYIGLSLFEGRLCCDFTTVFLITGAFGAGNHAMVCDILRAIHCVTRFPAPKAPVIKKTAEKVTAQSALE